MSCQAPSATEPRSFSTFVPQLLSFSKEVMFLRRLASGLAPLPMGLRLLTPVRVQTICQRSRAAGVLVFHHVVQHMPDAVVGACEALGTRCARGSRAPPYYRRRSASRANRCDDVVSPGQHVVNAPRRRTPPRGLPRPPRLANSFCVNNLRTCSGHVSAWHRMCLCREAKSSLYAHTRRCAEEGAPLSWRPSADAVAGNGASLNTRCAPPSADAVAGDRHLPRH
jgi:hypothetical protein